MNNYFYKAKSWDGQKINGVLQAASREEALKTLQEQNLIIIKLKTAMVLPDQVIRRLNNGFYRAGYRPYRSRDLMLFCRQLSTMFKTGLPLLQSLKITAAQSESKALGKLLRSVATEVENGKSLSEAMRGKPGRFPVILTSMFEAGETGGMLDETSARMADHYERQHDLEEKIRSATLYPAFIIIVALVVLTIMITYVLPQFAMIFNSIGMEMPFFSRLLFSLGLFTGNYWSIIAAFFMLAGIALLLFSRTGKGRLIVDRIKLSLPISGNVYRQIEAARFSRTLSTLLGGGITLHTSLILLEKTAGNSILAGEIRAFVSVIDHGGTIAETIRNKSSFPPLLAEMIYLGEESGTLDQTLTEVATYFDREVSYVVDRLGSILEPILILFVGAFVGMIVFSIMSPMYQVFQMI